ncbi:MAG: carboxyl transferase domain-containing protein, partial [Clostridiaceae bacterium]|nr:carboxyl transferase domain-containing protein [Clostridiaceae bacterium]
MTQMSLLNFIRRPQNELEKGGRAVSPVQEDVGEPEKACPNCHKAIPLSILWANHNVCSCGYHFRMTARQRINLITDKHSFKELFDDILPADPLSFPGYHQKLQTARTASNEKEAVVCGTAAFGGRKCCLFVMEPYFMMGSMGTATGEKITRL